MLLFLLGAFGMLTAEMVITRHIGGMRNVAIITSTVGAIAMLIGFFVKGMLRHLVVLLLLALSLIGLLSAWKHLEEGGGEARAPNTLMVSAVSDYHPLAYRAGLAHRTELDEDELNESAERYEAGIGEREGGEEAPPPLAPLRLSGLALITSQAGRIEQVVRRSLRDACAVSPRTYGCITRD